MYEPLHCCHTAAPLSPDPSFVSTPMRSLLASGELGAEYDFALFTEEDVGASTLSTVEQRETKATSNHSENANRLI